MLKTPAELSAQERINQKIEQVKHEIASGIVNLLQAANIKHLKSKGKVTALPIVDRNSVRWSLAWKQEKTMFDLSIVVTLSDDGTRARVDRVWVHRHAATPFDFDGHTPTTHMRRLTSLSIPEIEAAIEAEFK
jgi:hypothetical protein